MINNNLFGNTDILNQALNGSWMRNKVISDNIANGDTPGYKRKDVAFESFLQTAMKSSDDPKDINIRQLTPKVYVDEQNLSYRLDGNNVNVETEMVELNKNQIRYNVLIDSVKHNFNRIKTVIKN